MSIFRRKVKPRKIGFDVDDVLYPWSAIAHSICERAGITNGKRVDSWYMWESYGCEKAEWLAVINEAAMSGELYQGLAYPGTLYQLDRLKRAGHEVHLVTARGTQTDGFEHAELIRNFTRQWVSDWSVAHDGLFFTRDKATAARLLGLDAFIDDNLGHYDSLDAVGVNVHLQEREHNRVDDTRRRVRSVREFVDALGVC